MISKLFPIIAFIILVGSTSTTSLPNYSGRDGRFEGLTKLIPQQSCYYEAFNKRLACICKNMDMEASLDLKIVYFVENSGNEIREVQLRQCRRLSISLDFTRVDSTNYPVHFQHIEHLEIVSINFEPLYQDRQELELHFHNVQNLRFVGLYIMNTLKLKASNVKEARFHNSTFAHIPVGGFEVSKSKLLSIRDSIFLRVSPRSITVEKTKEVSVAFNEMTINALEVVYATDGSHLFISCNRILNRPISPECSKPTIPPSTTTTTTTSTTTTTTSMLPPIHKMGSDGALGAGYPSGVESKGHGSISGELVGGIIVGVIIIVGMVLLFLFMQRRSQESKTSHEPLATEMTDCGRPPPVAPPMPPEPPEREPLTNGFSVSRHTDNEENQPKFSAPIWIEEIQKNRIFNKQKKLLSEEKLKDISEISEKQLLKPDQEDSSAIPVPPVEFGGDEAQIPNESSRAKPEEDGFTQHGNFQVETQI